ncbi:MAG: carboxypeptidase-like regulatory domain-containing protein [Saprospiraceae bacterium]|nr:carboxypeptidase-like regulatory domain-containing protein [Candidatus Opimibacter iunctus]
MKHFLILCLIILPLASVSGQASREITGRILNSTTKDPVPYANVYNKTLEKGTISNLDGYFRVPVKDIRDSVMVIYIGYQTQRIALGPQDTYTIYLEESVQLLNEIVVRPKDNSYLADLLSRCRNNDSDFRSTAKAYYELKTYKDFHQIELEEGYYNADIQGYALNSLTLKAGRLALQPYENRLFASLESSRAITMMRLMNKSNYFPDNPMNLTKGEIKKHYYLDLDKKYLSNEADSIYVIDYQPKDTFGLFFSGKIWVNASDNRLIKINLKCPACRRHPFIPLFHTDSIANVSFDITMTFSTQDQEMAFNHIDFTYTVDYKSRTREQQKLNYSIQTEAILYVYDFHHTFYIPSLDMRVSELDDYRKLNAMPYNEFFWAYHDEYKLNDNRNSNELYFNDPESITNRSIFTSNVILKSKLFERPFVTWSNDRVFFKEISSDTMKGPSLGEVNADKYNLEVRHFVDINTYHDSTDVLTATIFDPYESYYHLPIDNKANCFINIYFDLCEIERLKLESDIRAALPNMDRVQEVYNQFEDRLEKQKYEYLKAVDRGINEEEMIKWNTYVKANLDIDNIALFKPYSQQ